MTNKGKNLIIIFLIVLLLLFLFSIIMMLAPIAKGSNLCYNEICPGLNETITLKYYSVEGICVCASYGEIVYAQPVSMYLEDKEQAEMARQINDRVKNP